MVLVHSGLLSKASFALLLLIFGCLVYIIARQQRLEADRLADAARRDPGTPDVMRIPSPQNEPAAESVKPVEYAPLRSRPVTVPPLHDTTAGRAVLAGGKAGTNAGPSSLLVGGNRGHGEILPVSSAVQPDFGAFAGTTSGTAGEQSASGITGQVFLRGTPPAEKSIALDPTCGRLHPSGLTTRHYVVNSTGALAEVFVYIKAGSVSIGPPIARSVVLDQVGCEYQPYVVGVQAGQTLLVRNSDPVLHNVHMVSGGLRERSVNQPTRGMTTPFTFPRREVFARFKCDVHPWMFAYVGVVDHPWFTVTDKEGKFTLPAGLATGRYTLAAAHPKGGELTQQLVVRDGNADPVTFVFDAPEGGATLSKN